MKNTLTVNLLGAAALTFFSLQAQALLIVDPVGTLTISQQDGAQGKINTAVQEVQFVCDPINPMGCAEPNTGRVSTASGIFDFLQSAVISMYDVNYADPNATNYILGHTLWVANEGSSNEFSMRIDTFEEPVVESTVINAFGLATYFQNGVEREDIQGVWYLTLIGNNVVGFSSTAEAYSVPEPGTMALLSIGLVGIGAARRSAVRRT